MYSSKYRKGYAASLASGIKAGVKYAPYVKSAYKLYKNSVKKKSVKAPVKAIVYKKRVVKKSNLNKRLNKLSKEVKRNRSHHTYRLRVTDACLSSANQQGFLSNGLLQDTYFDNAVAALRFFDPSNPATLVTADLGTSTYQQDINFIKSSVTYTVRNNYQVPCYIRVFLCIPKVDTSLSPGTCFTSGLADQGNPSTTNPRLYLTDSDLFDDIWKIHSSKKMLLMPGRQISLSYSAPRSFEYDPSLIDSHPSSYMRQYFACSSFVQVSGVVGHDTSLDEQGTLAAGVDIMADITFKIEYNSGGAVLNDFTVSNASNSFTNGPVVSAAPVADNQNYSVS